MDIAYWLHIAPSAFPSHINLIRNTDFLTANDKTNSFSATTCKKLKSCLENGKFHVTFRDRFKESGKLTQYKCCNENRVNFAHMGNVSVPCLNGDYAGDKWTILVS